MDRLLDLELIPDPAPDSELVLLLRQRATGSESGLGCCCCWENPELEDEEVEESSWRKGGRTGDAGAYISESCARRVGDVRAARRWRTLSHCVCVVCREDCKATRSGENGE